MPAQKNFHWYFVPIIQAIVLGLIFLPILAGGAFGHNDAMALTYPYAKLMDGRLFSFDLFWNNLNGQGLPQFFWQPVFYLLMIVLSPVKAVNFTMFLHALFGSWLATIFLKKEGFSNYSSLTGGIIYAFAVWAWMFDTTINFFLPLLPLLLLLNLLSNKRPWLSLAAMSASVAFACFGLHLHYIIVLIAAVSLFVVFRTINNLKTNQKKPCQMLLVWIPALLLGFGIGYLRLLPLLAYSQLSLRINNAYPISWWGKILPGDLFEFLIPKTRIPLLARNGYLMFPYFGSFFLAGMIFAVWKQWKQKRIWIYLLGSLAFWAFALPVTGKLLYSLPLMEAMGDVSRWLTVAFVSLIPVFCAGFEELEKEKNIGTQKKVSAFFLVFGLLFLGLILLVSVIPLLFNSLSDTVSRSFDIRYRAFFPEGSMSLQAQTSKEFLFYFMRSLFSGAVNVYGIKNLQLTGAVTAILITGVAIHPKFTGLFKKNRAQMLFLACALSLAAFFVPWTLKDRVNQSFYEKIPPLIARVKENDGLLLSYEPVTAERQLFWLNDNVSRTETMVAKQHLTAPNMGLLWNIATVGAYENLMPERLLKMNTLLGTNKTTHPDFKNLYENEVNKWSNLLDLCGVNWVLSAFELKDKSLVLEDQIKLSQEEIPLYLYQNQNPKPLAYFAKKAHFIKPDAKTAFTVLKANDWSPETTVIECYECNEEASFSAKGSIEITEDTATKISLITSTPQEQWLILLKNYLPGWEVLIDNQAVDGSIANTLYLAVPVESGKHEIVYRLSLFKLLQDSLKIVTKQKTIWI